MNKSQRLKAYDERVVRAIDALTNLRNEIQIMARAEREVGRQRGFAQGVAMPKRDEDSE